MAEDTENMIGDEMFVVPDAWIRVDIALFSDFFPSETFRYSECCSSRIETEDEEGLPLCPLLYIDTNGEAKILFSTDGDEEHPIGPPVSLEAFERTHPKCGRVMREYLIERRLGRYGEL